MALFAHAFSRLSPVGPSFGPSGYGPIGVPIGPGLSDIIGTGGKDFIHRAGDNKVAPPGYVDNDTATNAADTIAAGNGADIVYAANGDDFINGGAQADEMHGQKGNDIYAVDNVHDQAIELADEGFDTVFASVNFTLGDDVENLNLQGAAINGTGNAIANIINGNTNNEHVMGLDGADSLSGFDGADVLSGGDGDDTVIGGVGGDTMYGGTGFDILSYSGSNVPVTIDLLNHTASGGDAAGDVFTSFEGVIGGNINDTLVGTNGANIINGGFDQDFMAGRGGDDTYYVNDSLDTISEDAGGGHDTAIVTADDFTLPDFVEDLDFQGPTDIQATGNGLANTMSGNIHGDELSGLGAADTLFGGNGNDLLDGGTGADTLAGGNDNDNYQVDNTNDHIVEYAGGGDDTAYIAVSFTLPSQVDDLIVTVGTDINGTGNNLSNSINGLTGINRLNGKGGDDFIAGGGGDDIIIGGGGTDNLTGNSGLDTFLYQRLTDSDFGIGARDVIADFSQADHDQINLHAIDADHTQSGNQDFFFGGNSFDHQAGELIQYDFFGNTVISCDVDGDAVQDFEIELVGAYTLTAADIVI